MHEDTQDASGGNHVWRVYPLLYFDALWTKPLHFFDLDVRLQRADEVLLRQLNQKPYDAPLFFPWEFFDPEKPRAEWVLVVHLPFTSQHVPPEDIGLSFQTDVADTIAESFRTCLKVVRSTQAVCPICFDARVAGSRIELNDAICNFEEFGDAPRCDWPVPFEEADVSTLQEVWSGLIKVRRLRDWVTAPFQEEFFAKLDARGVNSARQDIRALFHRVFDRSKDEAPGPKEIDEVARREEEQGSDLWKECYRDAFGSEFRAYRNELFNCETRIGRALGIFEEGVHLPALHAFLSANLVLETLFTMREGEVTHRLAVRLARFLSDSGGKDERRGVYRRAKKVYGERSDLVHGAKSITKVADDVKRDAFDLARRALQRIMREDRFVRLYTQDAKGEKEDGGLGEFLEGLDLG
jgi:hypothetical protein